MDFVLVLNQTVNLFVLIVIGFILKKIGIMTNILGKGLSNLIIKVTLPALIITSMNYKFSKELLDNSIMIFLIGILSYGFMVIVSMVFAKLYHTEQPQKGVYEFLIIFPNVGFMGYPIVKAIFGDIGIFYGAVNNFLFNLLLWTLGVVLVSQEEKKIDFKTIINPGTVSITLGFLLFIFSIKLPNMIFHPLNMLGNTTVPLAMVLVGSMLGDAKIKSMFTNIKLFVVSLLRLIIIPVTLLLVLSRFDLPDIVIGIIVILGSMPSAANAAIFSNIYDSDYRLASQGVFFTTLLSVGTIPFIIYLLTRL